jgi:hypothetical protein
VIARKYFAASTASRSVNSLGRSYAPAVQAKLGKKIAPAMHPEKSAAEKKARPDRPSQLQATKL